MVEIDGLVNEAIALLNKAGTIIELDQVKVRYLGKEGELTKLLKGLSKLSQDERPAAGNRINQGKNK